MATLDPHSYADDAQPVSQRLRLALKVDFEARTLSGTATLKLDRAATGSFDLDTRDLTIESVTDGQGRPVPFEIGDADPIKGRRLRLSLECDTVEIRYCTSATATALQWLDPSQTAGGQLPYVFTQCQPIHARTLFPCQDTPRARITYEATLDVPAETRAVMAASQLGREETGDGRAVDRFEMAQPIPTYLFAFAVGDIVSREIGPRSKVFAEPALLDKAAYEFAEVETMIARAESLFGPYDWERFDLLVMPPSFPYGGMENPRLTFLTPTLIAGDRSLVNVVAHELAHSWTGNLVTNATMNDFWLNEGFTTYAERRILEALEGESAIALHAAIGLEGLRVEIGRFEGRETLTRLRAELDGVDPDEVYSRVPYEKGYLFVRRLEEAVGREAFDAFLKSYIETFRFQSITTETFVDYLRSHLDGIADKVDLQDWLHGVGLPDDIPVAKSDRFDQVIAIARVYRHSHALADHDVAAWSSLEWQVFLGSLPTQISPDACAQLDARFGLSASNNAEIKVAFLTLAANSGHESVFDAIDQTLLDTGRMKYLRPLYDALISSTPRGRTLAHDIFARARGRYHPVAAALVEGLLESAES